MGERQAGTIIETEIAQSSEPNSGGPVARLVDATVLGIASGMRTFAAPAALGLRGRMGGRAGTYVLPALAAVEMAGDKHPGMPARITPQGLVGRVISGAATGRTASGKPGAVLGAACATASTFATHRARSALTKAQMPGALLGAIEDILAAALAVVGSRGVAEPSGQGRLPEPIEDGARGLVSAAAGTAAMTGAQVAYSRVTGADSSDAPAQIGRMIVQDVFGRRVPRNRRDALNDGMHWFYGISWGVPLAGAAAVAGGRSPLGVGAAFGLGVWSIGLIQVPALGAGPPPWEQTPGELAIDAGFHLVFGVVAAATFAALDG